jgi:hypothetical protein
VSERSCGNPSASLASTRPAAAGAGTAPSTAHAGNRVHTAAIATATKVRCILKGTWSLCRLNMPALAVSWLFCVSSVTCISAIDVGCMLAVLIASSARTRINPAGVCTPRPRYPDNEGFDELPYSSTVTLGIIKATLYKIHYFHALFASLVGKFETNCKT